jgi:hypothetical protein
MRTASRDNCIECQRPVRDHFGPDREWVGCLPLTPVHVTVNGQTHRIETPKDAHRLCAQLKKAA